MKISLLSNVNVDMISDNLSNDYDVYKIPGFNQWEQICYDKNNTLVQFKPDFLFLFIDANYLFIELTKIDEFITKISSTFDSIEQLALNYKETRIYINDLDFKMNEIKENDSFSIQNELSLIWNQKIKECIKKYPNIHLFNLHNIVHLFGKNNFYSDKMWYLASMPYDIKSINIIANHIRKYIDNVRKIRKKLLVIDLDNTIWGGVVGEDGYENLNLGSSGKGLIYKTVQKTIKSFKDFGILLAIVSKNNFVDVEKAFLNNRNMILKLDDFVSVKCNWKSKSENIFEISKELNLGVDSFVFLDDNPIERKEVEINCPEVSIIDFPTKIIKYTNVLVDIFYKYFSTDRISTEDSNKTEKYKDDLKRKESLEKHPNLDSFIKSLKTEVTLNHADLNNLNRISQLTKKTNQFNLTTKRYSIEELDNYLKKGNLVFCGDVTDIYGKSGIVFVLMLNLNEDMVEIENLIMSCRVMGRKIELSIMRAVEEKLFADGFKKIIAKYIPTQKNLPVKNLMEKLNYNLLETQKNGIKSYSKKIIKNSDIDTLFESKWGEK